MTEENIKAILVVIICGCFYGGLFAWLSWVI